MMRPFCPRSSAAGFSLIEVVVAIAVIGVLAGAAALFLRGPLSLQAQHGQAVALAEQAGIAGLLLERELAQAQPNSVSLMPAGAGFSLRFQPRAPASGMVQYVCQPNATDPANGRLLRRPGNHTVLRHVAACRALDPQAPNYRGDAGRSQLIEFAYTLRAGAARLNVLQAIRVLP